MSTTQTLATSSAATVIVRQRAQDPFEAQADDEVIICRCEEITRGEIRRAIHDGMRTTGEVKRFLRAGMGLCQAQTCQRLVQTILSRELGLRPAQLGSIKGRMPVRPVVMGDLGRSTEESPAVLTKGREPESHAHAQA
jgi:NAD(P)H-nitrite reductase large subunit